MGIVRRTWDRFILWALRPVIREIGLKYDAAKGWNPPEVPAGIIGAAFNPSTHGPGPAFSIDKSPPVWSHNKDGGDFNPSPWNSGNGSFKMEQATFENRSAMRCDRCDGCGWHEGGPLLKNPCLQCGGTGLVYLTAVRGTREAEPQRTKRTEPFHAGGWPESQPIGDCIPHKPTGVAEAMAACLEIQLAANDGTHDQDGNLRDHSVYHNRGDENDPNGKAGHGTEAT